MREGPVQSRLRYGGDGLLKGRAIEFNELRAINGWYSLEARIPKFDESIGARPIRNFSCLLYTSPSPRDQRGARMPSSA